MTETKTDSPASSPQPDKAPAAPAAKAPGWRTYLAINSSTGALLGTILLVCMGSELWGPFLPEYMSKDLGTFILWIAVYGAFRDLLEAVNYMLGGWIAGRFNTRRGLLLFNAAPLVGLAILFFWHNTWAVFLAVPFVFVWDSMAGPALLTVVGDSLPSDKRAMAFSLQSLLRRLSKMIAYGVNAILVVAVGTKYGMQSAFAVSFTVVIAGLLVQTRFMKTASKDKGTVIHKPLEMLRQFHPQLKRLLIADILARLAEGMPRELIILFTVGVLVKSCGMAIAIAGGLFTGLLMNISQITSAITYLPMGAIASKPGFGKKPYIGLTFFFFATFPAVLALLGYLISFGHVTGWLIVPALAVAFVFMGMREVGEPARKAMIVDLIPKEIKTQCIGIYWGVRSFAVMLAPIVGGLIWVGATCLFYKGPLNPFSRDVMLDPQGPGPYAMLLASSFCGVIGVVYYYLRFAKGDGGNPSTA